MLLLQRVIPGVDRSPVFDRFTAAFDNVYPDNIPGLLSKHISSNKMCYTFVQYFVSLCWTFYHVIFFFAFLNYVNEFPDDTSWNWYSRHQSKASQHSSQWDASYSNSSMINPLRHYKQETQ